MDLHHSSAVIGNSWWQVAENHEMCDSGPGSRLRILAILSEIQTQLAKCCRQHDVSINILGSCTLLRGAQACSPVPQNLAGM